jgi:hypothetical protein
MSVHAGFRYLLSISRHFQSVRAPAGRKAHCACMDEILSFWLCLTGEIAF